MLVLRNIVGATVVTLFGKVLAFGLFGGSMSLAGGRGTAIAWANVMAERGLTGVSEMGLQQPPSA
jgi:ESS family glutamate:Na+ symporter